LKQQRADILLYGWYSNNIAKPEDLKKMLDMIATGDEFEKPSKTNKKQESQELQNVRKVFQLMNSLK